MRTLTTVLTALPCGSVPELPAPPYAPPGDTRPRYALGVESMRRHMSDEGGQLVDGLGEAGYILHGRGYPNPETDVTRILTTPPTTLFLQDRKEWDVEGGFRDPRARFVNWAVLGKYPSIFKLTVLKEAHSRHIFHADTAQIAGIHAWLTYSHPRITKHLAGFVRPQHLLRVYYTLDPRAVPTYSPEDRQGCLLSGAINAAYPLRRRLVVFLDKLPREVYYKPHPGYHRNGTETPSFLKLLSRFKVAICTSSIYSYPLRKLIEATACGCRVITDLATDEVLPAIDGNLIRISPDITLPEVNEVIRTALAYYDPEKQVHYAQLALQRYDYRAEGKRLATEIEQLRQSYLPGDRPGGQP